MNRLARFSDAQHKTHAIAIAIACSMLLVLSPWIPKLLHVEPGPGLPASFNGATSSENFSQSRNPLLKSQPAMVDKYTDLRWHGLFDHALRTLMNEPCTSQELIVYDLFGGDCRQAQTPQGRGG
jgi:hypothetical protein